MKLTVKTLKGSTMALEVPAETTVGAAKVAIEALSADMAAAQQKLIHAGKVRRSGRCATAHIHTAPSFPSAPPLRTPTPENARFSAHLR